MKTVQLTDEAHARLVLFAKHGGEKIRSAASDLVHSMLSKDSIFDDCWSAIRAWRRETSVEASLLEAVSVRAEQLARAREAGVEPCALDVADLFKRANTRLANRTVNLD